MAECAKITRNITVNCLYPLQAGTRDLMVLLNYDDWLNCTCTVDNTNPKIYTNIILPSGVTGYKVERNIREDAVSGSVRT